MKPPILFIVFNRFDSMKRVFEKIREFAPSRLYIAADGPRKNRPEEQAVCEKIRSYVLDSIDWPCAVFTLFRSENLGCGSAVSKAITWFFSHEADGIILEDDCIPAKSFFYYCEELLEKYKNDERIYHIAGNNPLIESPVGRNSYYFARVQHCWGWASWRRAWAKYDFDMGDFDEGSARKILEKLFGQADVIDYWLNIFCRMKTHEIDTWDYQWTYTIFMNYGMCINPTKNLISNIGFGVDATHTVNQSDMENQTRYELEGLIHPTKMKINRKYVNKIHERVFDVNTKAWKHAWRKIKTFIKKALVNSL
jgi:hypothetical protein